MKWMAAMLVVQAASASQISGTVVNLEGAPIEGVTVQVASDSSSSLANGAWVLGRSTGVVRVGEATRRVGTNLVVENGRLRLELGGIRLDGCKSIVSPPAVVGKISQQASRRTAFASSETLSVYWKGKRLVRYPLAEEDTSALAIRIDTGWADDNGFPWNPKIEYGTLHDERDGNSYRTVRVGSRTWMAEDLRYTPPRIHYYDANGKAEPRFKLLREVEKEIHPLDLWGTLYTQDFTSQSFGSPSPCPQGWHTPSVIDLWELVREVEGKTNTPILLAKYLQDSLTHTGKALRARTGWSEEWAGEDRLGFRLLPSGEFLVLYYDEAGNSLSGDEKVLRQGSTGGFWLRDTWSAASGGGYQFRTGKFTPSYQRGGDDGALIRTDYLFGAATIRCIQD